MAGSVTKEANGREVDEPGENEASVTSTVDDSNPFGCIVSEGESSGEEEGEGSQHPYTKHQDTFIQEAINRRNKQNQHCMSIFTRIYLTLIVGESTKYRLCCLYYS